MKGKIGKLGQLQKLDTLLKKQISKKEKNLKPRPKLKTMRNAESTNKLLDYLEQKRKESAILPLSGPNIQQNFIPCKFYSMGTCRYGRNCRYSHNFMEKIDIEPPIHNNNPHSTYISFPKTRSLQLSDQLTITHVKTFTVSYGDYKAKAFVAVVDNSTKIYIYTLQRTLALCSFEFTDQEQIVDFDFFPISIRQSTNEHSEAIFPAYNTGMLTIHSNNRKKLFNVFQRKCLKIYKEDTSNIGLGKKLIY